MNCKLSKESVMELQLIYRSSDGTERYCAACHHPIEDHRSGSSEFKFFTKTGITDQILSHFCLIGIGRVPLTRYNTCPRIRRSLRKNAVIGIVITVIVSLVVLALGTYMNYLISIRTQNTENVIDCMYMYEKNKPLSKKHDASTPSLKSTISLDTARILTNRCGNDYFHSDAEIYGMLSFPLLAFISIINIIQSCLCKSKSQTEPFNIRTYSRKQGVGVRTIVYVSTGTKTDDYDELEQEHCSI